MRKCCACERWSDHRHESSCPWCGAVPLTLQKLQAENARLRAQVEELKRERDEFLRAVQVMCDNESWWEERVSRAEDQAKRYREALTQIDRHWRMVGGALAEHSAICKIARNALEGGK